MRQPPPRPDKWPVTAMTAKALRDAKRVVPYVEVVQDSPYLFDAEAALAEQPVVRTNPPPDYREIGAALYPELVDLDD